MVFLLFIYLVWLYIGSGYLYIYTDKDIESGYLYIYTDKASVKKAKYF